MPLITEGIEIICMATKKKTVSKKKSVNKKKVIKRNPSAGGNTTKKKLPTATRLQIKRGRPGTGLGLFAMDFFKKGEMVVEYTGKRITTKHADTLGTRYLFEIDTKWTIDGSARSNLARYVNHACNPNTEAEIDGTRIFYYALRNIDPGEELTVDYGEEYFEEFIKPHGCKCGAEYHMGGVTK